MKLSLEKRCQNLPIFDQLLANSIDLQGKN